MKIGDEIDFYLFGNPEKGTVYTIKDWNIDDGIVIGVEHGGRYEGEYGVGEIKPYRYLVKTFTELPKKVKERPPWYIISENPRIRKKIAKKK